MAQKWMVPGENSPICYTSIPNPGSLLRDSVCQDVMGLGFPLSLAMLFLVLYFWPIGFCWLHWFDCTHLFVYSAQKYLFTLPPAHGKHMKQVQPSSLSHSPGSASRFYTPGPLGISLSGQCFLPNRIGVNTLKKRTRREQGRLDF